MAVPSPEANEGGSLLVFAALKSSMGVLGCVRKPSEYFKQSGSSSSSFSLMCSCGVSSALLWSHHVIACSWAPGSLLWYASPSRMSSSSSPMTGRVIAKALTLVHAEATNLSPRTSRILVGSEMLLLFLFKSMNLLCVSILES